MRTAIRDSGLCHRGHVPDDWQLIPGVSFGPKRDYLYAGDRLAVQLDWSEGELPVRQYVAVDHLNSTRAIVDDNGNLEEIDYLPFGGFLTGGPQPSTNHLFTGHERDTALLASNLDYMHARYFSPNLGRFLSVDPVGGEVGSSQSWNRYSYVRNNPIRSVDPTGEFARGDGFTDTQWEWFQKAQRKAAEKMQARAQKLEEKATKLAAKGKGGVGKLSAKANYLREGAAVLQDDSGKHLAHVVDQASYEEMGGNRMGAAGTYVCDPDIWINIDHPNWSDSDPAKAQRTLGHESLHTIGLWDEPKDEPIRGYKRGHPEQIKRYREMIGTYLEIINPDHLMDLVFP